MLRIGHHNTLPVARLTDYGAYLDAGDGQEVLIPSRYLQSVPEIGELLDVFVYTDSEDRPIATTERPLIEVGKFAFLLAKDVNPKIGAFMEWVPSKDLLCPFNEQKTRMNPGAQYLVYAYLDYTTKRVVASSKIEKYLGNVFPDYEPHQAVEALVYQRTDIGYKVIVDNLHNGMLYTDELIEHPEIGATLKGYVKKVRQDGKVDITLKDTNGRRAHSIADKIIGHMRANGGSMKLNDKSSPEDIAAQFQCSKKDFKKAVGFLLKNRKIQPTPQGWQICP